MLIIGFLIFISFYSMTTFAMFFPFDHDTPIQDEKYAREKYIYDMQKDFPGQVWLVGTPINVQTWAHKIEAFDVEKVFKGAMVLDIRDTSPKLIIIAKRDYKPKHEATYGLYCTTGYGCWSIARPEDSGDLNKYFLPYRVINFDAKLLHPCIQKRISTYKTMTKSELVDFWNLKTSQEFPLQNEIALWKAAKAASKINFEIFGRSIYEAQTLKALCVKNAKEQAKKLRINFDSMLLLHIFAQTCTDETEWYKVPRDLWPTVVSYIDQISLLKKK